MLATDIPVTMAGRLMAVPAAYESFLAPVCTYVASIRNQDRSGKVTYSSEERTLYSISDDRNDMIIMSGLFDACQQHAQLHGRRLVIADDVDPVRDSNVFSPDFSRLGEVEWRPRQFDVVCMVGMERNGVIDAIMAFGKSFVLRKIAKAYPNARMLFVVPGVQLMMSFHKDLEKEVGVGKVGRFGGSLDTRIRRLNVSTPESSHKIPETYPDVVFWDEVHAAATATGMGVVNRFNRAKMFGFTGTLKRTDGGNKLVEAMFGPVRVDVSYREAVQLGLITPAKLRQVRICSGESSRQWTNKVSQMRHCIWRNGYRNQRLIEEYLRYVRENPDEQALFSVDKLEHALIVQQRFYEAGFPIPICCGKVDPRKRQKFINNGTWVPGLTEVIDRRADVFEFQQRFMRKEEKYVIATSMFGTGLDFVHLGFIVYASSMQSSIRFEQTGGRGMRLSDGKSNVLIVDTYDLFDEPSKRRSDARYREAQKEGWEVERV